MKIANKENSRAKNNRKLTINCLHPSNQGRTDGKRELLTFETKKLPLRKPTAPFKTLQRGTNFNNILSTEKSCRCEGKLMDHSLTQRESKCFTDLNHRVQGDSYR